ncbi:MAG: HEAT repeat domain-containing protein [Planctomycetota bacterium]
MQKTQRAGGLGACLCLGVLLVLIPCVLAQGIGVAPDLARANWIWSSPKGVAGGGNVNYFRRRFTLPAKPAEATVALTADNGYELFVNGTRIAGELGYGKDVWASVERFRIEKHLRQGENVIAIRGEDLGGGAAIIAAVHIRTADGKTLNLVTDPSWLAIGEEQKDWTKTEFNDAAWKPAVVVAKMGGGPWGMLAVPDRLSDPKKLVMSRLKPGEMDPEVVGKLVPPGEGFRWPEGVVFLQGNVPKSHHFAFTYPGPNKTTRGVRKRSYPENDVPAPAILGRQMFLMTPAKSGTEPKLLLDAGEGTIGSPSLSYDGKTLYFSLAAAGEGFYHIHRMSVDGGKAEALTAGPFHDYDPEPLPDGRIVFSSTRIGSREEYHGNLASSLFVMNEDGTGVQPLTYHIVADREPRVTAQGALVMVRADNFLERAKVETQIHQVRPDGAGGVVLLGNDRGEIGYNRVMATEGPTLPGLLRQNGFGSPAPLPDGRVAAIAKEGLVVSDSAKGERWIVKTSTDLFDVSPMPDGRLLGTTIDNRWICVVDPDTGNVVGIHESKKRDLHSAIYLGPRPRPPRLSDVIQSDDRSLDKTGYLYCQSVFNTKQRQADLLRVKAIRIYEGRPLALRPERFPYVHIGVEAVELGTVPLAADGSFHARVPADRALALQAVDAEGRAVVNELTWIYVRPGERRSCVGCHSPRFDAPATSVAGKAFRARAVDLLGQGEPHRFRGNNAELGGIFNLQLERMREAAAINLYDQEPSGAKAGDAPLPPGRPAEVARLISQLRQPQGPPGGLDGLKISAAQRLAILHDRSAALALVSALSDPNPDVRMNAALALSACGNRDAAGPLTKALQDADPWVAQAANAALENLTGHTIGFDAFDSGEQERGVAAWQTWLRENGWDAIEADLIKRLTDGNPQNVILAAQALGHVGGEKAKAALRGFIATSLDKTNEAKSDLRSIMTAMRALGYLKDAEAVALLSGILVGDLKKVDRRRVYVLAAAAESLGWIGTPDAEKALIATCTRLVDFWHYTRACGDHPVLVANHSSIFHYRILEALDAMGTRSKEVVAVFIRSIPCEQDHALLTENDTYENLVARVTQRSGLTPTLMETCLHVLGDAEAKPSNDYLDDVTAAPMPEYYANAPLDELLKRPRGGLVFLPYDKEMRAAQVASVLALDERLAPRLLAAFQRYRGRAVSPVDDFPHARTKAWVCFYLARALGKVRHRGAVDVLLSALNDDPPEAKFGYEKPPSAIIYKTITPMYRAAVAYALGRIGDRRAVPSLLKAVANLDNALDVRCSAARGLAYVCDPSDAPALEKLAKDYPEVAARRALLEACEAARTRDADRTAKRGGQ